LKPLKGLGFKLVITQTFPVIPSIGIISYNPEAIYLNSGSPTSISSHHNLSDSGCFHTFLISPTLISKFYSKNIGSVGSNKGSSTYLAFFDYYYFYYSFLAFFSAALSN